MKKDKTTISLTILSVIFFISLFVCASHIFSKNIQAKKQYENKIIYGFSIGGKVSEYLEKKMIKKDIIANNYNEEKTIKNWEFCLVDKFDEISKIKLKSIDNIIYEIKIYYIDDSIKYYEILRKNLIQKYYDPRYNKKILFSIDDTFSVDIIIDNYDVEINLKWDFQNLSISYRADEFDDKIKEVKRNRAKSYIDEI